jgi:hypothetical protein
MPARARRRLVVPAPVEDSEQDLANLLEAMPAEMLARWYDNAPESQQRAVDRLLAKEAALGWRASPATMANHLLGDDEYRLWPYVRLLGDRFADAVFGRAPRQAITIPSQYGKTTIFGRWGFLWALDFNPRRSAVRSPAGRSTSSCATTS